MNGTTTLIDKKKILTYTPDKKLAIEGGVSILLSDSDLNSLTYTAYNYISNTYTELGKTGDGKIIASDPQEGLLVVLLNIVGGLKTGQEKKNQIIFGCLILKLLNKLIWLRFLRNGLILI